MSGRWRWLFVAGSLGYLLVDGHPESWLSGLPWRPPSLMLAVLGGIVLWVVWLRGYAGLEGRRRYRPILAIAVCLLALMKVAVGSLALPSGLPGWYFDNSRLQGDHEPSTDFLGEPWTRREREIFFGGDEFPAYFLNDVQRFNFFGPDAERRRNLPFSARWEGTLYVPDDGDYQFWLTASGPGSLRIDGRQVASVDADGRETVSVTQNLTRGPHPIRVTYARRPPRSPDLKVEWSVDGRRAPLAVPYLFPNEISTAAWERDRALLALSRGLDGLFLVLAGAGLVGLAATALTRARQEPATAWPLAERAVLGVVVMAIFLSASLPRLDRVDKLALLGGGQDWLTHESFARDILIGGPLMTLGKPLGEGRTFYAQPFYPYALAAMHALTGEDQFGVLALQVLGSGIAGMLLFYLARRLFGVAAAWATFGLFIPLWSWHLEWVSYRLISEAVYFVILPALLLALIRCLDECRPADFVLAGLLLGLAIVTRGPTLLYVPFVGAILWWGLRRTGLTRGTVTRQLAVLLVTAGLIVALVPLRNAIVAGEPALLASSGGVNLQKLHRPTNGVRLSLAQDRWFASYIQDAPTRETVEFVLQDPIGYLHACLLLAAYTLGYGAAVEESSVSVWPELIILNLLYLGAILFLAAARSLRAGLLHAFILIHLATMVIFVPYDYDNRLVLPMYLPMLVLGGYAVAELASRTIERLRGGASAPAALAERPRS
jgi:Dolichyl-phosphate-mannose-protein mannosyltransferase/PA14 domain